MRLGTPRQAFQAIKHLGLMGLVACSFGTIINLKEGFRISSAALFHSWEASPSDESLFYTFIIIIPKKSGATDIENFRPISCCKFAITI